VIGPPLSSDVSLSSLDGLEKRGEIDRRPYDCRRAAIIPNPIWVISGNSVRLGDNRQSHTTLCQALHHQTFFPSVGGAHTPSSLEEE